MAKHVRRELPDRIKGGIPRLVLEIRNEYTAIVESRAAITPCEPRYAAECGEPENKGSRNRRPARAMRLCAGNGRIRCGSSRRSRTGSRDRRQLLRELVSALPSVSRFLLETAHDDVRERRWNGRALLRHVLWCARDVRSKNHLRRRARKRRRSRQQLVSDNTERVDVRAMIRSRIGRGLLGRHV